MDPTIVFGSNVIETKQKLCDSNAKQLGFESFIFCVVQIGHGARRAQNRWFLAQIQHIAANETSIRHVLSLIHANTRSHAKFEPNPSTFANLHFLVKVVVWQLSGAHLGLKHTAYCRRSKLSQN